MKIPKNIATVGCLVGFVLVCINEPSAAEGRNLSYREFDSMSTAITKELVGVNQRSCKDISAVNGWYKDEAGSKLYIELNEDESILKFKFQIVGTANCESYETSGSAKYMHQNGNAAANEASWYSYTDEIGCTIEFDIKSNSVKASVSDNCGDSYGINGCPWPEGTFKK